MGPEASSGHIRIRTMPPKKSSAKKAARSPSPRSPSPRGRGCGPSPPRRGPEREPEREHEEPPPQDEVLEDSNISFKHEEIKGDEERDQLTNDEISDETLAANCFSDLGVSQDTHDLSTMTHEQFEAFKEFFNELGIPENALAPMTDEQRMKIKIALHLQQPGFGLKNDEPKTQNKTVEGPKHGLSTMDPGQLEDFKEPGREYKSAPTVPSQEESVRRNDSFMAYGFDIGIPKNALAIMTDEQRMETMEMIVELIKWLISTHLTP